MSAVHASMLSTEQHRTRRNSNNNTTATATATSVVASAQYYLLTLVDALFEAIRKTNTITDEQLTTLQYFFGNLLEKAIILMEEHKITMIRSSSGRVVFSIEGSAPMPYLVSLHHCTCKYFMHVKKLEGLYCKHQLAARIAFSLDQFYTKNVGDEQFNQLIEIEETRHSYVAASQKSTQSSQPRTW